MKYLLSFILLVFMITAAAGGLLWYLSNTSEFSRRDTYPADPPGPPPIAIPVAAPKIPPRAVPVPAPNAHPNVAPRALPVR